MRKVVFIFAIVLCCMPVRVFAATDGDGDGLSDEQEQTMYHTDASKADTDGDGFSDGDEVRFLFDPNSAANDKLAKEIKINLKKQLLEYYLGPYLVDSFKISSGKKGFVTPKGTYTIDGKLPTHTYKGADKGKAYYYPNTRWNLHFKQGSKGNYFIHGAYWNHHMGVPGSHGCVNVAYADMESLYNWADLGTKLVIF